MAVAFTREEDAESQAANLPDRPVSSAPNFVTPAGLALIDEALAEARAAYTAAQSGGGVAADRTAMARATRDLRYWSARRGSAQLVEPGAVDGAVAFGCCVTIDREDEADPAKGAISWVSPLAGASMGKRVGDVVVLAGAEVEIVSVG